MGPCAACKFLKRKCREECVLAPYFPAEEPQKFANVHKIFGASNVSKILMKEILPHQREDTVNSLAFEAEARLKDPVYGCVGVISALQTQIVRLQKELDATNAHLARYAYNEMPGTAGGGGGGFVGHDHRNSDHGLFGPARGDGDERGGGSV